MKRKETIDAVTGWALVILGAFIFSYGLFGMFWWESSVIHEAQNNLIARISENLAESGEVAEQVGIVYPPNQLEK